MEKMICFYFIYIIIEIMVQSCFLHDGMQQCCVFGWWYRNDETYNITWENECDNPDKSWRIWYQDEIITPEEYSYFQWQLRPKPTFSILFNLLLKWDWNTILGSLYLFVYPHYQRMPLKFYWIRKIETKKKIKEYIFGQLFHLSLVELPTDLIYLISDFVYETN